ncbi:MAG: AhpC/TSA family protein [Muribaculaceae bacterium]|nr:AhpC/TSA family protein [Muribaculaceae bacterium]
MKLHSRFLLSAAAVSAVFAASAADPYKLRIPTPADDLQGAMLYLVNYDTGEKMDSALIDGPELIFSGEIDEPVLTRMIIDGDRAGSLIIENGSIVWSPERREAFGSPLNDKLNEFGRKVEALSARLTPATPPADREQVFAEYETLVSSTLDENADNPIGYYLFIQEAAQLSESDFEAYLKKYPSLANYQRVSSLRALMTARANTQPGHKYVNFTIPQPDGKVLSLSDFVKTGKYTLVDFWASWCGPCIHEIGVLKQLWDTYHDRGLDIVGVAVWDKTETTLDAIKRLEIPWPCILDAQTVPTDLYGISGIPCIILINPEGTIISRDKQDTELMLDVMNAMNVK